MAGNNYLLQLIHYDQTGFPNHSHILLTHSCLEISLSGSWSGFVNNFGINHEFKTHLKENCVLDFDQYFSFKYFLDIVLVREILPKWPGGLDLQAWMGQPIPYLKIIWKLLSRSAILSTMISLQNCICKINEWEFLGVGFIIKNKGIAKIVQCLGS